MSEIPDADLKFLMEKFFNNEETYLEHFKEFNYIEIGGHLIIYKVRNFYEYIWDGNYCTRVWSVKDLWDQWNGKLRDGFGHNFWYDEELSEKRGEETFIDKNGVIMYSDEDLEYSKGEKPICCK